MSQLRLKTLALALLLAALCALLAACRAPARQAGVSVRVDGAPFDGASLSPDSADDLRVYVTYDGATLIDLPFGEAHTVALTGPDSEENTIALTGDSVYMYSANCENQDCVNMGAVTRDNLELRVMGGFIICLPHRVSVEVRGK